MTQTQQNCNFDEEPTTEQPATSIAESVTALLDELAVKEQQIRELTELVTALTMRRAEGIDRG